MLKRLIPAVFALVAAAAMQHGAWAATTNNFYGEVVHVSVDNVKVYDPKNHQTLSFVTTPKFDQVFSANGKTTYQMKDLKAGQYVRVVYDQKALGMRHADKIYILNNANMKTAKQIPSHIH
jgi:Cu/Ag efflux protein CusF